MNPYARPKEKKIGANRPKIEHRAEDPAKPRTHGEREAEKRGVAAQRRAIKKSARRHLREEMLTDLAGSD